MSRFAKLAVAPCNAGLATADANIKPDRIQILKRVTSNAVICQVCLTVPGGFTLQAGAGLT